MIFKCIICGAEIEQITTVGKLYCSTQCRDYQANHKPLSVDFCKEEQERRKQAYLDAMPPEKRHKYEIRASNKKTYLQKHRYASKGLEKHSRFCHDCGKPCNDFRCKKCWARVRGEILEPQETHSESEWDYF